VLRNPITEGANRGGKRGVVLNPDSAAAISEFLKMGGQVSKLPPAIAVTGQEVVEYLLSSGVAARCYTKAATTTYIYKDKPVTLRKLVEAANRLRCAEALPPFAARVELTSPFAPRRPVRERG
jgi:hypothetical protein